MASYRAIRTISDVLVQFLKASHEVLVSDEEPDSSEQSPIHESLQFDLYQGGDFQSQETGSTDVSLFLYRVSVNGTTRTPPGRRTSSGETQRTQLPLDLHYLVTVWAQDAKKQHQIAGWLMRTLETTPILPKGVLNGINDEVFRPDETVEIILNDLSNEELFRIWDIIGESYRLSIPYLVRNVRIESEETVSTEGIVERRIFDVLETGLDNGTA